MNNILSNRLTIIRSLIVLFFLVIVVVLVGPNIVQQVLPVELTTVDCIIGSEKAGFLENPEVQNILANEYGLEVDYQKQGSIEMVTNSPGNRDCLWPSNRSAEEIFEANGFVDSFSSEVIFNSPIVLYSWTEVVDALQTEGLFEQVAEGYYTVGTQQLIDLITQEDPPTWVDLGMSELPTGRIAVNTTDPLESNSGNMFYALMANMLVEDDLANRTTIQEQLPVMYDYYQRMGMMSNGSGDLFADFITLGLGPNPIIANYESLIIEFVIANQDSIDVIRDRIRVIYPQPTVWSSHPLIALTDEGRELIEALRDERLQSIAWEQHGFRSGFAGVTNDPAVFNLAGIPDRVTNVINLPRPEALLAMLDYLEDGALDTP